MSVATSLISYHIVNLGGGEGGGRRARGLWGGRKRCGGEVRGRVRGGGGGGVRSEREGGTGG